jgi:hypothetical protein
MSGNTARSSPRRRSSTPLNDAPLGDDVLKSLNSCATNCCARASSTEPGTKPAAWQLRSSLAARTAAIRALGDSTHSTPSSPFASLASPSLATEKSTLRDTKCPSKMPLSTSVRNDCERGMDDSVAPAAPLWEAPMDEKGCLHSRRHAHHRDGHHRRRSACHVAPNTALHCNKKRAQEQGPRAHSAQQRRSQEGREGAKTTREDGDGR